MAKVRLRVIVIVFVKFVTLFNILITKDLNGGPCS